MERPAVVHGCGLFAMTDLCGFGFCCRATKESPCSRKVSIGNLPDLLLLLLLPYVRP